MLKIFQGCWITSLSGIDFKNNSRRSSVVITDKRINDFSAQKLFEDSLRAYPVKSKIGVPIHRGIKSSPKSKILVQMPKKPSKEEFLFEADPTDYKPSDFANISDTDIKDKPPICPSSPISSKKYSSYSNVKRKLDFQYRDYSHGDFKKDQKILSKRCNKKLQTLNLPVFVEDGTMKTIIDKKYLYE